MIVKRSLAGVGEFARGKLSRACWLSCILGLLVLLSLAGCSGRLSLALGSSPTETATAAPTATPPPSATPTPVPTATLEPTATATATPIPPTETPLPPLAVLPDGFNAWCAPVEYAGTLPEGPEAPAYARQLSLQNGVYRVPIPAVYCAVIYRFNQAAPAGLELRVLDGSSPFIQQTLEAAAADTVWTALVHPYVVNPPFWEVTYTLSVQDASGSVLWSSPVTFAKALPEPCLFGGLPDPVTLACPVTDPWEIEPWPDVEYPYDRSRLTPDP